MSRRVFLTLSSAAAPLLFAADAPSEILRGKLFIREGKPATMGETQVTGDEVNRAVLTDPRLDGFDAQARGHFTSPGHFLIDPSHTHSLLIRKDGRLMQITYFCGLCGIRAYTPGPCVCCQQDTELDLVEEVQ